MRRLRRPDTPAVLGELSRRNAHWNALTSDEKRRIRNPLEAMSTRGGQVFCNYCESAIQPPEGHIEHLAPRASHPALEFDWDNLFLSCDESTHCGHFKDSRRRVTYSPERLIHPDVEDPDAFFHFLSSGKVEPRAGLDPDLESRATMTINALNLNDPKLVQQRAAIAKQVREYALTYLDGLEELTPAEREEFFEDDIAMFEGSPFLTTVRHFYIEG